MRKKNLFKKLIATAGAMVMALTMMMPMGVSAVESTTYPTSGTGTLTITKYDTTNSGDLTWDTSDNPQTEPTSGTKLGGVTFSIRRVGTISQEIYGDGELGLLYQIKDTNLQNVLSTNSVTPDSGTDKYTSTTLNAALKSNPSSYEAIVTQGTLGENYQSETTSSEKGDDFGKATFSGLEFGLYLVAETAVPADITGKSVPFFVSIPSIVNGTDEEGNTTWTTDVNAYPKNTVGTPTIDKAIQAPNSGGTGNDLVYQTNANIGDTITYEIPITAIVPADGLKQLYVEDRMTKGLTYNSAVIYAMIGADDRDFQSTKLVSPTNYTIGEPTAVEGSTDKVVKISFNSGYLDDLKAGQTYYFRIVYNCTLNNDAVLGQTGNTNSVELYYSNSTSTEDVPNVPGKHTPKVFTYGIDLTKTGEDEEGLEGVQFVLTDNSNNPIYVESKTVDDNTYYVPTGSNTGSNVVTTITNGKLYIRGLEPGTYKLTETKTNQGYVLLKDPVTIKIDQTNSENGAARAYLNGSQTDMADDNLNPDSLTAKVELTVVNNKGFDLPQTGAAGTALFAIVGIVLAAVAGGLLFFLKRSPKRK